MTPKKKGFTVHKSAGYYYLRFNGSTVECGGPFVDRKTANRLKMQAEYERSTRQHDKLKTQ